MPLLPGMVDGLGSQLLQRRQLYAAPMSQLRQLMICRMAKPEEVLIVEDENGNIVRETMKDNDVLVQYKVQNGTSWTMLLHISRLLITNISTKIRSLISAYYDANQSQQLLLTIKEPIVVHICLEGKKKKENRYKDQVVCFYLFILLI